MSIFGPSNGELKEAVREAADEVVEDIVGRARSEVEGLRPIAALRDKITALKEEVETLRIEKARREERFERREREIEHKVGLHRKQVETERDLAEREAKTTVREEHLEKRQEEFEDRMEFMQERFEEEIGENRKLLSAMLERLPSAEILANIGGASPSQSEEDEG